MTLYEFLDDVRCGNVGRLCVAICGEDDYLDNFQKGMYWALDEGNWHAGSASPATPDLPDEILEAEVTQLECHPNLPEIYAHLDNLNCDNWHYTVVLVEEPEDFDAEEYWTEENLQEPISPVAWPYAINRELWFDLQELEANWTIFSVAVGIVGMVGYLTLRDYTEEQLKAKDPLSEQVYRLAQKISWRVDSLNEVMAMMLLIKRGSPFRENVATPCKKYESIPYKDLWTDITNDDEKADDTCKCSECGAEVLPTIKELKSGHFVCPKCSTVLNSMNYVPTIQCCVCGGKNALSKEENEKGELVCSHCGSTLFFDDKEDSNDEHTTDKE